MAGLRKIFRWKINQERGMKFFVHRLIFENICFAEPLGARGAGFRLNLISIQIIIFLYPVFLTVGTIIKYRFLWYIYL